MNYGTEDRALALAGVCQAAALVADVAQGRALDRSAMRSSLQSLFVEQPDSVADVFGGLEGVRIGTLVLRDALDPEREQGHGEVLRYVLAIIAAERRLAGRARMQATLHKRMQRVREQLAHFEVDHDTIVASLATVYQDTLSTMRQRIQVTGSARALQEARNAERIRALLLAGVRAALLWHQTGGRRWRLLLNRAAVHHAATRLVERLDPT